MLESAGPPVGGSYLNPPSSGGLCDGVTTMRSAQSLGFTEVVTENRVRDDGRRRVAVTIVDHHLHVIGRQNFERRCERRFREGVSVDPHEEWTVDAVLPAIETDRLSDGEDVLLVERALARRSGERLCPEPH